MSSHDISDGLKAVFSGILDSKKQDDIATFEAFESSDACQRAIAAIDKLDYDQFYFSLFYPYHQLIDGLLERALPGANRAHFILEKSQFIENHLSKLFSNYEGGACSTDKARTVIKQALRFHITGTEVKFDWQQKYTYHLPEKILTTHASVVEFLDALQRLYYGMPEQYLSALLKLQQDASAKQDQVAST